MTLLSASLCSFISHYYYSKLSQRDAACRLREHCTHNKVYCLISWCVVQCAATSVGRLSYYVSQARGMHVVVMTTKTENTPEWLDVSGAETAQDLRQWDATSEDSEPSPIDWQLHRFSSDRANKHATICTIHGIAISGSGAPPLITRMNDLPVDARQKRRKLSTEVTSSDWRFRYPF